MAAGRGGAYGHVLSGLPVEAGLLPDPPPGWPELRIEQGRIAEGDDRATEVGPDHAQVALLGGGKLELDRRKRLARFLTVAPVSTDELAHPYLAVAASTFAGWLGRDSFHAGAFVADGGAFGVLASKTGGKSTTLAELARRDVPIVADDVLVVDARTVFAGPRCIDLRHDAELAGVEGADARGGTRFRVALPPLDPELPLRGFVQLSWGDRCELVPLPAAERLILMARFRWDPAATDPAKALAYAELPAWELRRPRGLDSLAATCDLLLSLPSSH